MANIPKINNDSESKRIQRNMTDTQKKLFCRYSDCVQEHQETAECMLFQNSFCLGAKIMLEIMAK